MPCAGEDDEPADSSLAAPASTIARTATTARSLMGYASARATCALGSDGFRGRVVSFKREGPAGERALPFFCRLTLSVRPYPPRDRRHSGGYSARERRPTVLPRVLRNKPSAPARSRAW